MKDIEKLRNNDRILNHLDIMEKKTKSVYIPVGLLEFHPYDKCPLSCLFCTYHDEKNAVFKFDDVDKLRIFDPRAIVISGGGEPVYYQDGDHKFNDLVIKLRKMFPNAQLGLTSNGQFMPDGRWHDEFDWVRVSLDTDNEKTFKMIKDGELLKSLKTLKQLMETNIKHVGAGYVYSRFNIEEVYGFLRMMYEQVYLEASKENREKLNIQFRPTCMVQSCDCPSASYNSTGQLMVPDYKQWWEEYVEEQRKRIFENDDREFQKFVLLHSNLNKEKLFKVNNSKPHFDKCWSSLARIIVRANGDMYPCVIRARNGAKPIGNILNNSDPKLFYYNQMLYHNLSDGYCDGPDSCCRIDGHKNEIVDEYVKIKTLKKKIRTVDDNINYFF